MIEEKQLRLCILHSCSGFFLTVESLILYSLLPAALPQTDGFTHEAERAVEPNESAGCRRTDGAAMQQMMLV